MTALAEAIQKVATGPHLSKDLTQQQAYDVMIEVLSGDADPVQAAIFLIALRIKRETNEENLGIWQALQAQTPQQTIAVDNLLLIAEPFNGFNRHCPVSAFLPTVLAASGLATLSQGVKEMGPKFGVTHHQVLAAAGIPTLNSTQQAADLLTNPDISWAYLDQAQASPSLFALQDLRKRMIKRPSLATLEKLLLPVKAEGKTHLQIGFVHKAYSQMLAWLSTHIGFDSALIIRGIEGGIVPTLRESANCFQAFSQQAEPCEMDPKAYGLSQTTRGVLPMSGDKVTAQQTAELGLAALAGQAGAAFDSLVYGAAMALWHCRLQDSPSSSADYVRKVIKSGRAKAYLQNSLV